MEEGASVRNLSKESPMTNTWYNFLVALVLMLAAGFISFACLAFPDHISYSMSSSFSSPRASCLLLRADGWWKDLPPHLSSNEGPVSFTFVSFLCQLAWMSLNSAWPSPCTNLPPLCWASSRNLLSTSGGRIHFLGRVFLLVSYCLRTHCNLLYSLIDENFSLSIAGIFEMVESLLSKPKSSRHKLSWTFLTV